MISVPAVWAPGGRSGPRRAPPLPAPQDRVPGHALSAEPLDISLSTPHLLRARGPGAVLPFTVVFSDESTELIRPPEKDGSAVTGKAAHYPHCLAFMFIESSYRCRMQTCSSCRPLRGGPPVNFHPEEERVSFPTAQQLPPGPVSGCEYSLDSEYDPNFVK